MYVCLAMDHVHIYEFAVEFGFLRMSPKTRRRLNISTKLIVLGCQLVITSRSRRCLLTVLFDMFVQWIVDMH